MIRHELSARKQKKFIAYLAPMYIIGVCVCVCVCVSKISETAKYNALKMAGKFVFSCITLKPWYVTAKLSTGAKVGRKIKRLKN